MLFEINLLKESQINLELINLSGKILRTFINEKLSAGKYQKRFSVNDLQGGKYFLRLNNGNIFSTKSLIIGN